MQLAGKTFDNLFTKTVIEDKTSTPAHPLAEQCIVNSPSIICDPSDPRTVLTVKSTSKKAIHITQFLSERTKKRCQSRKKGFVIATSVNDENLVLKQEDEHPYSGITMDEWSAANCRLMSYLIHSGELLSSNVDYYLAYSTHIYMTGLGSISGRPYWILTFSIENVRLNMVLMGFTYSQYGVKTFRRKYEIL